MAKSTITVAADVAGKVMVSATGNAAERIAAAAAAALAFVGIAVGYRIYAGARERLVAAKSAAIAQTE